MTIYLDANATMPIKPDVIQVMNDIMRETGNASSIHKAGRTARAHIEKARESLAKALNTKATQITFNSGATETLNTLLRHFPKDKIWVSTIEHPAGHEVLEDVTKIPVTPDGIIDLTHLEAMLSKDQPDLISIILVNNETGVIQPIKDIVALAQKHNVRVHSDASQALGRIPLDVHDLGVDYLSLSGHKCGGPQGVGVFFFKPNAPTPKLFYGGGQEKLRRAGTENVAAIAGFGLAADLAVRDLGAFQNLETLRDHLETQLVNISPEVKIWGQQVVRICNTTCLTLNGVPASTMLMNFDMADIYISSGSACSSGTVKGSYILQAMSASQTESESALRISLSWQTTQEDIDAFLTQWEKIYARIKHKVKT